MKKKESSTVNGEHKQETRKLRKWIWIVKSKNWFRTKTNFQIRKLSFKLFSRLPSSTLYKWKDLRMIENGRTTLTVISRLNLSNFCRCFSGTERWATLQWSDDERFWFRPPNCDTFIWSLIRLERVSSHFIDIERTNFINCSTY